MYHMSLNQLLAKHYEIMYVVFNPSRFLLPSQCTTSQTKAKTRPLTCRTLAYVLTSTTRKTPRWEQDSFNVLTVFSTFKIPCELLR